MKRLRPFAILAAMILVHVQLHAWSGPGHAAVGAMAYRELATDPALRSGLANLLHSHPKFAAWKAEYDSNASRHAYPAGMDFSLFLFIRAATWPDEIRRTTDPALVRFDHPSWHYVDYPLAPPAFSAGPSPAPDSDAIFGIRSSLATLGNRNASATERAAALSWVIHLIGDIHQPLHCATLITPAFPAPEGDQGGNNFLVFLNADQMRKKQTMKLHSFWDQRLGSDINPDPVKAMQDAKALAAGHSRASLPELAAAGANTSKWSVESRTIAASDVYRFHHVMLRQQAVLPAGYVANADRLARRRLALAGYRLRDSLKKIIL